MKPLTKTMLTIGGGVLLVGVLAGAGVGWWTRRQLDAAIAGLRADGHALALAAVAPRAVSPDRNAALRYKDALAKLVWIGDLPDPTRGFPEGTELAVAEVFLDEVPDRALREGLQALPPHGRAAIARWLVANRAVLDGIAAGARLPACRWDRDYRKGFALELPELNDARTATLLIAVRVLTLASAGQHAEALSVWQQGLALAEGYRDEPMFITQRIRISLLDRLLDPLQTLTLDPATPATLLESFAAALPEDARYAGMLEGALRGELAIVVERFAGGTPGWGWLHELDLDSELSGPLFISGSVLRHSAVRYFERMTELIALAKRPHTERAAAVESLSAMDPDGWRWDPISALLFFSVPNLLLTQTRWRARLAVARAGLRHAAALREGKPAPAVTAIDPFSGKPLRVDAATGRLYSVGPNQTDDGGKGDEQGGDDLVWRTRAAAPKGSGD